jgi:integrase
MATTSPLRQRMIEDMMIRNLSRATQQSYIYAVARFSRHFNSSPDRLGMEEVRAYQLHLVAKNHSWSHINQVAFALRFFYGVTLGQKEAFERIVFGREPEKLPAVLNAEEVVRFLEAVEGLRNRIALTTAYAAGLRVREVTRLRIASIDSARMLIHIEMGKGGKERYAMLSPHLLAASATKCLAVPRPGTRQSREHGRLAGRLPQGAKASQDRQARHRAYVAAQFRHPSPGGWRRHSHHSGVARPCRPVFDDALCTCRHEPDRQHALPLRSTLMPVDPA